MPRRPGLVPLLFALTVGSTLGAQATVDWHEARVLGERSYTGVMAYDSARDRTVLCNGTTWEWDGRAWAQMSVGPPGFFPTAMVFHVALQRCVAVSQRAGLPWLPNPNLGSLPLSPNQKFDVVAHSAGGIRVLSAIVNDFGLSNATDHRYETFYL